jgi:small subunit ribosomal protein S20
MPNTPSATKRLKQSQKRRAQNRIAKKVIKTFSRRAVENASSGKLEQAETDFRFACSKLDKAGMRRILHPNTASRRKARLTNEYTAALAKSKTGSPG